MSCNCHDINMKTELVAVLAQHERTLNDIIWVGGEDYYIPIDNFLELIEATDYYPGFGWQEVAKDLVVMCNGGWLERQEYDGSEWWEFKTTPVQPDKCMKVKHLTVQEDGICGWSTLDQLNSEEGDAVPVETEQSEESGG